MWNIAFLSGFDFAALFFFLFLLVYLMVYLQVRDLVRTLIRSRRTMKEWAEMASVWINALVPIVLCLGVLIGISIAQTL
jgi:lipopolysaccharide export LptBFGC system permease protein LptF